MRSSRHRRRDGRIHGDVQDTTCAAWSRVLQNIEDAAKTNVESFAPLDALSDNERADIVALPASVGDLRNARELSLP
jgi:hypothetical protein